MKKPILFIMFLCFALAAGCATTQEAVVKKDTQITQQQLAADAQKKFSVGKDMISKGQVDKGMEEIESACKMDSNNSEMVLYLGKLYLQRRNFDPAIYCAEWVLKIQPNNIAAKSLLEQAKNHKDETMKAAEAAYKAAPVGPEMIANQYIQRGLRDLKTGLVEKNSGKTEEGLLQLRKATEAAPKYAMAWHSLGRGYHNTNKHNEAIEAYKKALEIEPKHAESLKGLGNLYIELNRLDEAKASFEKALEINPRDADAWDGRGSIFNIMAAALAKEAERCKKAAIQFRESQVSAQK